MSIFTLKYILELRLETIMGKDILEKKLEVETCSSLRTRFFFLTWDQQIIEQ